MTLCINVNRSLVKEIVFERLPAETMTEADYANDLVLLANSPTHAESMFFSFFVNSFRFDPF